KLRPGGFLRAGHGTAVLDLTAPQLAGRGLSAVVRPMLYGGPRLVLRDPRRPPPGYRVLAKHGEDGSASILSFRYASASGGWVVLSSFHPSVLTDDGAALDRDHDDYRWAGGGADPDGAREDWKLAAALVEIALGLPVQKAPPLPRAAGSVTVPAVLPLGQTTLLPLSQPSSPGAVYVLLASASVVPGVPLGDDVWLPLTFDVLLQMSLQAPSVFQSFVGTLDGQGRATAKLALPALPALRGLPFEFAFVTRGATRWLAASAPAGGVTQ
ncbi:MAG: hypothetical protein QGG14_10760, partial [Planctomycetota bacterium]|nr:hypothetical protein [Planctomycetota bacterium]